MNKDLPNIFKGKPNNSNNQESSIGSKEIKVEKSKTIKEIFNKKSVDDQIKDIFNSSDFMYKANVLITYLDGEEVKKTIIGRTNNSLITLDDELIKVKDISKIDLL